MEIARYDKIVPDAFHGTPESNKTEILAKGFAVSSGKQFLGDGVYFFESSVEEARRWGKGRVSEMGLKCGVAVFQASINLGRCLDLNAREHRELLRTVKMRALNNGHDVDDATVINLFSNIADMNNTAIDTVRATNFGQLWRGGRTPTMIFAGSKFFEYTQLIICVRNCQNISNMRLCA